MSKIKDEETPMEIVKTLNDKELTIALKGNLDSTTSIDLEKEIENSLKDIEVLIFEFAELNYLSSAGLRILLVAQKIMDKQGKMIIRHVNSDILNIFAITGFDNILTIE